MKVLITKRVNGDLRVGEVCGEVMPAGAEYCPGCDEGLEDIIFESYSVWLEYAGREIELC
jgi:hypothetical protein